MAGQYEGLRRERTEGILQCLSDHGFPGGRINSDGTTTHELTEEQNAQFDEASAICVEEACPHCGQPPSEAVLTRLYHLEVAARTCLLDRGVEIDEPPSLEVYLATPAQMRWSTHMEARTRLVGPGSEELAAQCPDPGTFITYFP